MDIKYLAISAAAALTAVLGATWLATSGFITGGSSAFAQCCSGAVAGGDIGGPFSLIDETGQPVTDVDVITAPSIIYFGYTNCPDVCPVDTMRNAIAVEILDERGITVNPIFITIDPARDTVDVVARFTDNFHDRMLGLTGSEEQVKAAADAYRVYFNRHDDEDTEFYIVDHSAFSYIVLPETGFADFVRREITPEQLAEQLACYAQATAN
ncbi:MAG: SCO family protein [Rhodobacteraceae bacterium]|nr:SCO family protein [Paracoccaceae bacterium]